MNLYELIKIIYNINNSYIILGNLQMEYSALEHFNLGDKYHSAKDYKTAFLHYKIANELHRATLEYSIEDHEKMVDGIIKLFTKENIELAKANNKGNDSSKPVFIVGMCRSGSSVLEQMLDLHPSISGIGESKLLAENADLTNLTKWSNDYISAIECDSDRIVNKQLYNYLCIGLIHIMFPNAKIIHTKRNPLETLFSCWKLKFLESAEWSYTFEELARYYKSYVKLMQHWKDVCPDAFIEVQYEDLVLDQLDTLRVICEYINVEFDAKMMYNENNTKECFTASAQQVTKPLYKSSLNTSDNYKKDLQELITLLN